MTEQRTDITRMLLAWSEGDKDALDRLTALLYGELKQLAARCMRSEQPGHTLQATAVVNEAYERLFGIDLPWHNRAHFLGVAAQVMRRIVVDHARARGAQKRGGDLSHIPLDEALEGGSASDEVVLGLDQALEKLGRFDPVKGRILELRFFGGLTYEEAAAALDMSKATFDRELRLAKAWLRHEMQSP